MILSIIIVSGCVGQSNQEQNQRDTYNFETVKDAYESGFQLKCELESPENYRSTYYIANKNIRIEIAVPAGTTYKIVNYNNQTFNWTEVNEGVPDPDRLLRQAEFVLKFVGNSTLGRSILLGTSLTDRMCIEQTVPQSLFEPPQ